MTFADIPLPYSNFKTARVVILPLPYDRTTEWRSGARDGPQAIIEASQYLEFYDPELDKEIYKIGIHTLPPPQPLMVDPKEMVNRVCQIATGLIEEEKLIAMLGGEHSLTLGVVQALKRKYANLSVLQLDAHADLRNEYLGTKYSHACAMRRVIEICPIVPVGIRSWSAEEQEFMLHRGIHPFLPQRVLATETILAQLPSDVYITIDLDVLDPTIMAAVGTPEPGGIGWQEMISLLQELTRSRHIVGFDVMELCPGEGPRACAFLAAKLVYKLIGYITV